MAVYKIKRFSFKDKFKGAMKGAALGASIGSLAATPFAFDAVADKQLGMEPKTALKGVLGAGIIGATVGAYRGWKNTKSTPQLPASKLSSIKVDEPTNLEELFRKYPKLREMESIIKNKEVLDRAAEDLDFYGITDDYNVLTVYLVEDLNLNKLWYNTKQIRHSLQSQDWIACIGNVYFNTKDNNFYLITNYNTLGSSPILKKITIKEYGDSLINQIDNYINLFIKTKDDKSIKIEKEVKEIKNTLKRVFKV